MTAEIEIHKFGGRTMADALGRRQAADRLRAARAAGRRVVAVVSAREGVTDTLLDIARDEDPAVRLETLFAAECAASEDPELFRSEARGLWRRALKVSGPSWRRAALLALGETWSALRLVLALRENGARFIDTSKLIPTQGGATDARPLSLVDDPALGVSLRQALEGEPLPVLSGFVGCDLSGRLSVMPRGGSDLTAAWVGAALGATRIRLWKTVRGLCEADPDLVPDAPTLARLSYAEAELLAVLGARVLAPGALEPAASAQIPVELLELSSGRLATRVGEFKGEAEAWRALVARSDDVALLGSVDARRLEEILAIEGLTLRRERNDDRLCYLSREGVDPRELLPRLHRALFSPGGEKPTEFRERRETP
jgi:aspartate kinase